MAGQIAAGVEIAGHRIESVIGHGGMGTVYLAEHLRLGRKVALKVLKPDLAQDDVFRRRFVRESQLAARLDHPNVITIYDAGEAGRVLYISMRYVPGPALDRLLRVKGPLSPAETLWVLAQVARALDVGHAEGLVHRDVKPGNILLRRRRGTELLDHVYLTDFGITKNLRGGSDQTDTSQFVGTIDYTAPEQISGGVIDGRTDVYSLGCCLFQCQSGQAPYSGDSVIQVMYAHLQDSPPAITAFRPELPAEIDDVVRRALAKRPEDRFETCGELIDAARDALAVPTVPRDGISAPPIPQEAPDEALTTPDHSFRAPGSRPTPVIRPTAIPRRGRRRVSVVLGAIVFLAAGVGAGAVVLRSHAGSPRPSPSPTAPAVFSPAPDRIVWARAPLHARAFRGVNESVVRAIRVPQGLLAIGSQGSGPSVVPRVWLYDGRTWQRVTVLRGLTGQGMSGVLRTRSDLIAVGTDYSGSHTRAAVWTSADGHIWNLASLTPRRVEDDYMVRVVRTATGLVAVGYRTTPNGNTDARVWLSADGHAWKGRRERRFGGPGEQMILDAAPFDGGVAAVGHDTYRANTDAAVWWYDGTRWVRASEQRLREVGSQRMLSVTDGPAGLVAAGFDDAGLDRDPAVWTASDQGVSWSRVDRPGFRKPGFQMMEGVTWTPGAGYVAAGRDGVAGATWSSSDGKHWKEQRLTLPAGAIRLSWVAQFHSSVFAFGRALVGGRVEPLVWPGRLVPRR